MHGRFRRNRPKVTNRLGKVYHSYHLPYISSHLVVRKGIQGYVQASFSPTVRKTLTWPAALRFALPAVSYSRVYGANERLNLAAIETGGKGQSDLEGVAASPAVQVTGLCDIDSSSKHLGWAAARSTPPPPSSSSTGANWLDNSKTFGCTTVSTPDFMHAPISLAAMQLGKHVFCQKPLTHTVYEARQMRLASQKYRVVTQMGNQIQSHTAYRTAVAWVQRGHIGKVRDVHSLARWQTYLATSHRTSQWSGPNPLTRRLGFVARGPRTIDLIRIGMYHPFNWRVGKAYGTGQLGDFGCHILDPVFKSLKLTAPTELTASAHRALLGRYLDRSR